jgi:hypothetical protein
MKKSRNTKTRASNQQLGLGPLLTLIGLTLLAMSSIAHAALTFSNGCDNELTSADRSALVTAYNFMYEHQQDMYDEVITVTADGNVHNYDDITSSEFSKWQDHVEKMEQGKIVINCHYNTTAGEPPTSLLSGNRKCKKSPGLNGWSWDGILGIDDDVNLCIENLFDKTDNTDEFIAAMAGTIAHELMHHADGLENHPAHSKCGDVVPQGYSDKSCPADAAQTAGVAMEHLALSAELSATITGVQTTATGDSSYTVTVDARITNSNSLAGDNTAQSASSSRNGSTYACLLVDGVEVDRQYVSRIDGYGNSDKTFAFETDVATDGAYQTLEVLADCDEDRYEWNESNNLSYAHNLELTMDLDVDVQLAAAPRAKKAYVHTPSGLGSGMGSFGSKKTMVRYWEVDYLVTVQNNEGVESPVTELTFIQDDHIWPQQTISSESTIGRLAEGDETSFIITVLVRANSALTAPSPATDVSFEIDADGDDIFDSAPSNNSVAFAIDAAYWRPDYTPTDVEVTEDISVTSNPFGTLTNPMFGSGSSSSSYHSTVTISLRVGNFGPVEPSDSAMVAVYDADGILLQELTVDPVAIVDESEMLTFTVEGPDNLCDTRLYSVVVDSDEDISENDESNNVVVITVGGCPDVEGSLDLTLDLDRYFSPVDLDKYLQYEMKNLDILVDNPQDIMDFIKEIALGSSNGPFLPVDEAMVMDLMVRTTEMGMLYTTVWLNTAQQAQPIEIMDTHMVKKTQEKVMYKSL